MITGHGALLVGTQRTFSIFERNQNGLLVTRDRRFMAGAFDADAGEHARQVECGPLQLRCEVPAAGAAVAEIPAAGSRRTDAANEEHAREQFGESIPDHRAAPGEFALGRENVRATPQQIGRCAHRHQIRQCGQGFDRGETFFQRLRRASGQHRDAVRRARDRGIDARHRRQRAFVLGDRTLQVKFAAASGFGAGLGDVERGLLAFGVLQHHVATRLQSAQLEVVACHFRRHRDLGAPQVGDGGVAERVLRLHAAHAATEQADFPAGVETDVVEIAAQLVGRCTGHFLGRTLGTIALAGGGDHREQIAQGGAPAGAGFAEAGLGDAQVVIGGQRVGDQGLQLRIREGLPVVREHFALLQAGGIGMRELFRQGRIRAHVVGTEHAAAQRDADGETEQGITHGSSPASSCRGGSRTCGSRRRTPA